MIWNWQQPGWPAFAFDPAPLHEAERLFLLRAGVLLGAMRHIKDDERQQLTVDILSDEAVTTSRIEGEFLNRDSVQSSIRRQFGLTAPIARVKPAECGVAELMVDLYQDVASPLTEKRLFTWHRKLMQGRGDLDVGAWRRHDEPMQVVSGALYEPRIHFEAPPTKAVPRQMNAFIKWFNATAPSQPKAMDAVARAALAHLYFVSIHPFEDGNGRIARALSELALSQALGRPTLIALSRVIESRRNDYYEALEVNNKSLQVDGWMAYFAEVVLAAQAEAHRMIAFLIEKARLFDRLCGRLNPRQEKVILRLFRQGPDGFKGGLSAGNYVSITRTSTATASRDLAELVELNVLARTGEKKHTRYHLILDLPPSITDRNDALTIRF